LNGWSLPRQALGEQEAGEALQGGAEDVGVLGWLDRVLELALAVDDHTGYGAAFGELRFFLQELDLSLHFVELVVGGVGDS
jgi:hypothetical protein